MIGLGPGLTPAGDDFLLGVTAALKVLGKHSISANNCHTLFCQALFSISKEATTFISREALIDGAKGRFSLPVIDSVNRLLCLNDAEITPCLHKILNLGASSGFFILAGIVSAVNIFNPTIEGICE
jgi:hypothetical protein